MEARLRLRALGVGFALLALSVGFTILALSACGEVPHPFEDDKLEPHAALLAMPDAAGIVVEPIEGLPGSAGPALAEAMAKALEQEGVLASTEPGNAKSFHLIGTAEPDADGIGFVLNWSMRAADGTEIGQDTLRLALLPDAEAAALTPSIQGEALKLAALIQESAPAEHEPTRRVLVRDIEGAPGDGGKALKRALVYLLKQSGTALTEDAARADTIAIAGIVEAQPGAADQDHLKIQWHVLTPEGSEAGIVTQENDVPDAAIRTQWGDLAMAVATAAAPDIQRLAETVPKAEP